MTRRSAMTRQRQERSTSARRILHIHRVMLGSKSRLPNDPNTNKHQPESQTPIETPTR